MTDTTVVNMRTSEYDVPIDRSSPFGNPFHLGKDGGRTEVLGKYREYFYKRVDEDADFKRKVLALRGKRLGCWCAPMLCHGMIIAEYIENHYALRDAVKPMDWSIKS